jgi:hypothetical protein
MRGGGGKKDEVPESKCLDCGKEIKPDYLRCTKCHDVKLEAWKKSLHAKYKDFGGGEISAFRLLEDEAKSKKGKK